MLLRNQEPGGGLLPGRGEPRLEEAPRAGRRGSPGSNPFPGIRRRRRHRWRRPVAAAHHAPLRDRRTAALYLVRPRYADLPSDARPNGARDVAVRCHGRVGAPSRQRGRDRRVGAREGDPLAASVRTAPRPQRFLPGRELLPLSEFRRRMAPYASGSLGVAGRTGPFARTGPREAARGWRRSDVLLTKEA